MQATQRVEFAARLAHDLQAYLIGVVAQRMTPYLVSHEAGGFAPDARIASLYRGLEAELKDAETGFRRDFFQTTSGHINLAGAFGKSER